MSSSKRRKKPASPPSTPVRPRSRSRFRRSSTKVEDEDDPEDEEIEFYPTQQFRPRDKNAVYWNFDANSEVEKQKLKKKYAEAEKKKKKVKVEDAPNSPAYDINLRNMKFTIRKPKEKLLTKEKIEWCINEGYKEFLGQDEVKEVKDEAKLNSVNEHKKHKDNVKKVKVKNGSDNLDSEDDSFLLQASQLIDHNKMDHKNEEEKKDSGILDDSSNSEEFFSQIPDSVLASSSTSTAFKRFKSDQSSTPKLFLRRNHQSNGSKFSKTHSSPDLNGSQSPNRPRKCSQAEIERKKVAAQKLRMQKKMIEAKKEAAMAKLAKKRKLLK